jgi:predicted cobalt transporter CbtA
MTTGRLVRAGASAGVVAGVLVGLMQWLITEPIINRALAIEELQGEAEHSSGTAHHHDELVTRTQQVIVGIWTDVLVAVLFGIVFAVVFMKMRHRLPGLADHVRTLSLAALGFYAFAMFPALAMPANPPAVGNPSTIAERTLLYLGAIILAVLVLVGTFAVDRALLLRREPAVRTALSMSFFVVASALVLWLLPKSPDALPTTGNAALIPGATLIWQFRIASLAQLAMMWLSLGTVFGLLLTRSDLLGRHDAKAHSLTRG